MEGVFAAFVLLSDSDWDQELLRHDLQREWGLSALERREENGLGISLGGMTGAVRMVPAPAPDGVAEKCAENNYMWPGAVEAANAHRAYLVVTVVGNGTGLLERGKLFVKLVACCCGQKNALGVYTGATVFEPHLYRDFAGMMKKDMLPVFNWVWFGLYVREGGSCCYTHGMELFGKDEMEILDADAPPSEVRNLLWELAGYVLNGDVTLRDGDTIGVSEEDTRTITRSPGVALPGMTLKISC